MPHLYYYYTLLSNLKRMQTTVIINDISIWRYMEKFFK